MKVPYNLILDLQKPSRAINIEVMRADDRAREMHFSIISNGTKLDMSDVGVATIKGIKPDGAIIYADCEIRDNGSVVYAMSDNVTDVIGKVVMMLELYSTSGEMIQSFEFYVLVKNQLFDENDYLSQDDLSGFKSYLTRAQKAAGSAESVKDAFVAENGELKEIKTEYIDTLSEYADYYEDLKAKERAGYFNGAQGARGERGSDAVVTMGDGIIGFAIEDGELMCYYYTDECPVQINEDGELVINFG